jgi:hypothetical protein
LNREKPAALAEQAGKSNFEIIIGDFIMNYNWTEQQIQAATEKGQKRNEEDWLSTSVFKVGNKRDNQQKKAEAADIRRLMAMLVGRDSAFDNEADVTSEKYKISFNWASKERLLRKIDIPRFFSPYLLSSLERLLLQSDDSLMPGWDSAKRNNCISLARLKWGIILEILRVLDETGAVGFIPSLDKYVDKNAKKMALCLAESIAYMYKMFEIGWDDIRVENPGFRSHDEFFLAVLREQARADFEDLLNPPQIKLYADIKRVQSITNIVNYVVTLVTVRLSGILPNNMRKILDKNKLFQDRIDPILKESKALYNRSPWQKEYLEKLLPIIRILLKSPKPEVRKAAWDYCKVSMNLINNVKGIIRLEIDNRTKANKTGK